MSDKKVTREVRLTFGVSRMKYDVHLPAGLRVKPVGDEPMRSQKSEPLYWLDEFPTKAEEPFTSFPINSFIRHDATHYGIRLTEGQVQDA